MDFKMPSQAHPAGLKLRVKELDRALSFYTGLLGFQQQQGNEVAQSTGSNTVRLGLEGKLFFLDLVEDIHAPIRLYPSVGLYHFALLLPDRVSLAGIFKKLVDAGWDFEGAADHGVSEALYLRDPEKNGIELYRDRPKQSWRIIDGRVAMVTDPLDVYDLLEEAPAPAPLHSRTRLGHMHLHVDDLERATDFYEGFLGLNARARLPGAAFLAAGDYHHHLGLNTWAGNRRASPDATGLLEYTWKVPPGVPESLAAELQNENLRGEEGDEGLVLTDPVGITVRIAQGS